MEHFAWHTRQNVRRKTLKLMQRQMRHSMHISRRNKPNAERDDEPNGASVSNPATQFNVKEVIAIEIITRKSNGVAVPTRTNDADS
jgi:hypothetical protein